MKEEAKKDVQMCIMGATHMPMWDVQFEDNENPNEKENQFVINVAGTDEKMVRWLFGKAEPGCTIKKMEEVDHVIVPIMSKESNEITLNQYQAAAMTTCMPSSRNIEYMLLNLIGEVGELAEKFLPQCTDYNVKHCLIDAAELGGLASRTAKAIRKGELEVYNPIRMEELTVDELGNINKELGDVLWQTAGLAEVMSAPLEFIAEMNLAKLAARKKAGTIDGNGDGVSGKERTV